MDTDPLLWKYPVDRYYYDWYLQPPHEFAPTDGDVKAMVVDRLRENVHTKDDTIRVDVKRNVVILSGNVGTTIAKRAAGDDAWDTPGVVDVSNQLSVGTDDATVETAREPRLVREVMTPDPICLESRSSVFEAAQAMRNGNVGDVIVLEDGLVAGILTDRDIVIRDVADDRRSDLTAIGTICTRDVATLEPDHPIEEAVLLMRDVAVRRVPVVEDGRPIGIVSIGDLAVERDPESALADISAAPPNR